MSVDFGDGTPAMVQDDPRHRVLGRIGVRKGDGKLLLGQTFGGNDILKPGHVYEIRQGILDDTLTLADLGMGAMGRDMLDPEGARGLPACWGNAVGHIVNGGGWYMVTRAEWDQRCAERVEKDGR